MVDPITSRYRMFPKVKKVGRGVKGGGRGLKKGKVPKKMTYGSMLAAMAAG